MQTPGHNNAMVGWLITGGLVSPVVFWITLFACGALYGDYSHLSDLVSELGRAGAKTQYIFTAGLLLTALLSILFIVGLFHASGKTGYNTVPILILVTLSFSIAGAAVFPLPYRLHGILGSPSLVMPLSPLLALLLWRRKMQPWFSLAGIIALCLMALGFLVYFPEFMEEYSGLKQRFFHLGWSLWFIGLSLFFLFSARDT